jgi:hypothetical protein
MPIFTAKDLEFFDQNGYVIARNVVPQTNLDAVIAAIWEFLGMNPHDPNDWYRPPHSPGGMVELYQHQALWDNRQLQTCIRLLPKFLAHPTCGSLKTASR